MRWNVDHNLYGHFMGRGRSRREVKGFLPPSYPPSTLTSTLFFRGKTLIGTEERWPSPLSTGRNLRDLYRFIEEEKGASSPPPTILSHPHIAIFHLSFLPLERERERGHRRRRDRSGRRTPKTAILNRREPISSYALSKTT